MAGTSQLRNYRLDDSVAFRSTRGEFGGLSNMAPGFPLKVNGVSIRTSEALYQACRFPHRPDLQRLIIDEISPMTAKMRSKPHRGETRPDWEQVRVRVMRWCLQVKLAQNWESFGHVLLSTGDRHIVEDSTKDEFWGAKKVEDSLVGMNVLGRLLMELRKTLRGPQGRALRQVPPLDIPDFCLLGEPIRTVETTDATAAEEIVRRRVDVHADARKRFDEQGAALLRSIVRVPHLPKPTPTFQPDLLLSNRVTRANIESDVHISHRDQNTGEVLTQLFSDSNGWVGLLADGVRILKRTVSGLQRLPQIEPIASEEFVEKEVFLWLKASFRAQTSEPLVASVLRAIETAAKEFTVVVPLSDMFLEGELKLGDVTVKTFPKALFDQMERSGHAYSGDESQAHLTQCRELRETHQGHAVAETTIYAELIRAKQVALIRTQAAIGVLRIFAPSHIEPDLVTYWAPWGHHSHPKQYVLFCEPADRLISTTDEILGQTAHPVLDTKTVTLMNEMGLESFRTILAKAKRTDFEEDVLSATIEFGQAALVPELHLRLIV